MVVMLRSRRSSNHPLRDVCCVTVATLLVAAPAIASTRVGQSAGTTVTSGDAYFGGKLTWTEKGRVVQVRGRLEDVCPADGYSARLLLYITTNGVDYGFVEDFKTTGKCGSAPARVKVGLSGGTKQVRAVKIVTREYDDDGDQTEFGESQVGDEFTGIYRRP
jgi:hypothetical protein